MWIEHDQTMWFQALCLEILLVCLVIVGTGIAGSVWMHVGAKCRTVLGRLCIITHTV